MLIVIYRVQSGGVLIVEKSLLLHKVKDERQSCVVNHQIFMQEDLTTR